MSPLHPKLRELLLQDAKKNNLKLTPELLLEYESLLNQYYHSSYYSMPPAPTQDPVNEQNQTKDSKGNEGPGQITDVDDKRKEIKRFRDEYLPNYDAVHAKWVEQQKRTLLAKDEWPNLIRTITTFLLWLKKHFLPKTPKPGVKGR